MAIYAKDLAVEIRHPPGGGGRAPEYLAVNPIGKVPALVVDDSIIIPESETIVEFLEDSFPHRALRPARPTDIARSRLLARIVDLYLLTPGQLLIPQFDPRARDQLTVDDCLTKLDSGLAHLENFMSDDRYAVGETLTTADCALVPMLFYLAVFAQVFGKPDLLARFPRIARYWAAIQAEPSAQRVIAEIQQGLDALRS
jgi:glutathione S-transferase